MRHCYHNTKNPRAIDEYTPMQMDQRIETSTPLVDPGMLIYRLPSLGSRRLARILKRY